jgi:inorganic pyrophosphatase
MPVLSDLPSWNEDGDLNVVVESPRGSTLKFEFDPAQGVFSVSRALPAGLAYPFDWGFIPGTQADDGDPVDALVLHDAATFTGLLLPCRVLGMVLIRQRVGRSRRLQTNNRILATPCWNGWLGDLLGPAGLSRRLRGDVEQFFLAATLNTDKHPQIQGWKGAATAEKFIKSQEA